jgi:S-adenosylmethionine synthetase
MIRVSEMVLPGHPDKFCDQVADAVVQACYAVDEEAYCQVEMSCWSDEIFLTGGIVTARPLQNSLEDIVRETGHAIGYVPGSAIDVARYRIRNSVCQATGRAAQWTRHVNDQCISIGWAGYDERVAFLPPEHFLAHVFREALTRSFKNGRLARQGPDGKLIVRLRENSADWVLEHVLVTVQHLDDTCITEVSGAVATELRDAYNTLRERDRRWAARWEDVELLVNPNGPLVNGGSDGDNGQTGRKLAMDYYGPRVPIGGGALSGKDLTHIDRAAAYALRQAAVHAVRGGATECLVTGVWAPNVGEPLDIIWQLDGRAPRLPNAWFGHAEMVERQEVGIVSGELGRGRHFFDGALPWQGGAGEAISG